MKIHHNRLQKLIHAVFSAVGSNSEEAECISHHLVHANLTGHDSHGAIRVFTYIQWLNEEKVFVNRKVDLVTDSGALLVLDGNVGFGQSIGKQAINLAIDRCREHGVAIMTLRNSGHLGRIGHWAEMAIDAGLVSLHFINSTGLGMRVVPSGGIDSRLSINPITVGIPVEGSSPFVLDIAAAMVPEGKLKVARNKGLPIPEGLVIDADGRPNTDPNDF